MMRNSYTMMNMMSRHASAHQAEAASSCAASHTAMTLSVDAILMASIIICTLLVLVCLLALVSLQVLVLVLVLVLLAVLLFPVYLPRKRKHA